MRRPKFIARQAGNPRGWLGRFIFRIMARETADANVEALSLLTIDAGDHVIDIGCGHGAHLSAIVEKSDAGLVVGCDHSAEGLGVAGGFNGPAIAAGKVRLELAPADRLPFDDGVFDKALSIHTVYFWENAAACFSEIARVLRPGGTFVLGFRAGEDPEFRDDFPGSVYTFRHSEEVLAMLLGCGLQVTRVHRAETGDPNTVWAVTERIGTVREAGEAAA
ncbi:MAG: class I SAM-dependent methyltransferase [Alphaproteobacteria bacterium]|nr:class I SAM-dependent methyltransferase [Alphaproteobacteria bacterium]